MSRRKRKLLIVSLFMAIPFAIAAWYSWHEEDRSAYIPGEQVEGLTARLDREVPNTYRGVRFKEATGEAGIDFYHYPHDRTSQLPEDMGSGAAWLDFNNDGWDDLFILNYARPLSNEVQTDSATIGHSKLYKNNRDGTFSDISSHAGLDLAVRGMGAAAGDFDNDGATDLFITTYGENRLYRNTSEGTFIEVTQQAGVGGKKGFWAGASWSDYDRDGDLDLYITGYVTYRSIDLTEEELAAEEPPSINPSTFDPVGNLLYKNNGDGTFTEISRQAGVQNKAGRSLSATWIDLNKDQWPDLYVANDVSDNVLYLNNKNGTFVDVSHLAHVADYRGAMGIAGGDWDNDQDADLFITHWIAQENALYTNGFIDTLQAGASSVLQFTDDSANHGLGQSSLDYIGWATSFVDFDLDGRLDLFVVNGSTNQYPDNPVRLHPMNDQIFWNAGRAQGFYEVSKLSGPYFAKRFVGRGGALSDYDRDGDQDLFIVNHNGPGILLRNDNELGNNWLAVKLAGQESNRSAYGAQIRLVSSGTIQLREVGSQSSYLSQNSSTQHFGLGDKTVIDTLSIAWPSGTKDVYLNVQPNTVVTVTEGETGFETHRVPKVSR
ncbi:CRTAC1 family protein [Fodinibius sediminis]|uniref:Repeat domain-containing protein n=1 Tax=Fodinibius sediminis TaxID=1214077 RepID=A0A521BKM2_9BACT|nr:CRTAC1 family protein [Fodinibius sediminis]SMO47697.1 Repeat domain-containing protein [Fodinibius sediminis]